MYSKWPKLMPISGIKSAWLLYEMAMAAPKPPSRALAVLQHGLLACAPNGPAGLLAMRASEK